MQRFKERKTQKDSKKEKHKKIQNVENIPTAYYVLSRAILLLQFCLLRSTYSKCLPHLSAHTLTMMCWILTLIQVQVQIQVLLVLQKSCGFVAPLPFQQTRSFSSALCSVQRQQVNAQTAQAVSRRKTLQIGTAYLGASSAFLAAAAGAPSAATGAATGPGAAGTDLSLLGVDCLKDLPPFDPTTTVRVFLARHGETENNRLHKLQGARLDAPINETGERQAVLLGQALARAPVPPQLVLHSPLLRAQQTAQIAAAQLTSVKAKQKTLPLNVLTELDFGEAAEGELEETRRMYRLQTYAQWASGNLDVRMNTSGETGREVRILA